MTLQINKNEFDNIHCCKIIFLEGKGRECEDQAGANIYRLALFFSVSIGIIQPSVLSLRKISPSNQQVKRCVYVISQKVQIDIETGIRKAYINAKYPSSVKHCTPARISSPLPHPSMSFPCLPFAHHPFSIYSALHNAAQQQVEAHHTHQSARP